MAISPRHPCARPGCRQLVERGVSRCDEHVGEYDARRGTFRERGYDSRWDAYSREFRRTHPLCACGAPATLVDHRKRWQSGKTEKERERLKWDPANHAPSCTRCHGVKSVAEDGWFGHAPRGAR